MKTYRVAFYETLIEYVDINAENESEAEEIAWSMLDNGEVDFSGMYVDTHDINVEGEIECL